jgi:hypothetical protein
MFIFAAIRVLGRSRSSPDTVSAETIHIHNFKISFRRLRCAVVCGWC